MKRIRIVSLEKKSDYSRNDNLLHNFGGNLEWRDPAGPALGNTLNWNH